MNSQRDVEKVFQELLANLDIVTEICVDAYIYDYSEITEFFCEIWYQRKEKM